MEYTQKKTAEERNRESNIGPNGGVITQSKYEGRPMTYEDVGLMFVMPPLVQVTAEEAERLSKEFGKTNIQKILDECEPPEA